MAVNDDGDFELVLGNKQLISVFMLVVILLGVFFSMGYIVGRNSTPIVADAGKTKPPLVVDGPPHSGTSTPQDSGAQPATQPASQPTDVGTDPEQRTPESAPAAPAAKKTDDAGDSYVAHPVDQPPSGQYWQVAATTRPEAEIVAEVLRKKSLHTVVAPASKAGLFRVLIGPMRDAAEAGQIRTKLEDAGFKNPIHQRY